MSRIKPKPPLFNKKLKEERDYWLETLARDFEGSKLRPDYDRTSAAPFERAALDITLPPELTAWLSKLTAESPLLIYAALHAALKVCLYKYTDSKTVVVGSPPRRKEDAPAPAPNVLAVVDEIDETQSFRQFLQSVRVTLLEAYARQSYPYEQLIKQLSLDRPGATAPLFDVVLSFQGLHAHLSDVQPDISISVARTATDLQARIDFNAGVFRRDTVERLGGHWTSVLRAAAEDINAPLRRLEILTPAEREQISVEWNNAAAYPIEGALHELFERQAERVPDAVALTFEDRHLSYADLDARANRLAHHLRELGVGPEVLVGLYVERSPEMIAGLLAILKAGGAYVPLDPAYPRERLTFMLEDAGVRVLLTHAAAPELQPPPSVAVVNLDADRAAIEQHSTGPVEGRVDAEQAAYVIYTSGSTGTPKGVVVSHANVNRLFQATQGWYNFDEQDVWTMFHSFAFDFSVWEIWGALLSGGRLVIVPYLVSRSPESFLKLLRRERVTVLNQTPSAFTQLMRADGAVNAGEAAPDAADALSLRLIIFGGEALDARALRPWFARHGDASPRLVNMYGITETTVHVTYHPVSAAEAQTGRASVIGKPIPDLRLHILDRDMNAVPVGVVGELFVGGAGLARGYLNRSELTAERFVPDPFGGAAGGRLYRTGDRGRRRADGEIEFEGRADYQIKIRGFRIEPGEIETVLRQHPTVRDALVIAQESTPGDKRLIAYVVPQPDYIVNTTELRGYLQERVPDYMVPAAYAVVGQWPLTPSGKVDRRALPEAGAGRAGVGEGRVGPRTEVEEAVAAIWRQVLGAEEVGVEDNFFELGGHSLLATQVISRVRECLGVDLPMRTLFEQPTVQDMALAVERINNAPVGVEQPAAIRPAADRQPGGAFPLSFGQQRLWFLHQLEPASPLYNIPLALRLRGPLDAGALTRSLVEIARRHDSLRTSFGLEAGQPVQRVAPAERAGEWLPVPVTDLSGLPAAERAAETRRLIDAEANAAFDLSRGPLVNARLVRLGAEEHVLLWTMHHIVSDGWSLGILIDEVAALYGAFVGGQPSPLPELPIQYADYAVWQREWLQGEVLDRQLSYWKEQLGGQLPVLELPTDRPRPAVQSYRGATEHFHLGAELTTALDALSQREGVTLFMVLLAAFQTLLHRYTGEEDIAVGSPIANRTRREVEGLIGFFVNTLVLRTQLGGDPTFRELLGRVKEVALGAYAHQDVPFEKLVEELQPARSLAHTPLFQVLLSLQNVPGEQCRLPGVTVQLEEARTETAKFELTLSVRAEGGAAGEAICEYNADLYEAATIRRLGRHWINLLEGAMRDPARPLSQMALMGEDERRLVVTQWSGAQVAQARGEGVGDARAAGGGRCVHELFEAQARAHPERAALVSGGVGLSYGALNERANRVARYLRRRGAGPEAAVGVLAERSAEAVAGLLGVLKAGAAYVPLDAAYPQRRIAAMLEDSQVKILLTQEQMLGLVDGFKGEIICLDTVWEEIDAEDGANLESEVTSDNLAYVIYTSGSTGKPKGVMVSHGNVVNFFAGMDDAIHDGVPGTWLAVTSVSFDISVLELFWTLTRGFGVVIQQEQDEATAETAAGVAPDAEAAARDLAFSLFYFASDEAEASDDRYRLLLEGAKFADRNNFTAVWTPERHFHAFGGLYPNPAITSAALAAVTERVQIRAGSVVLPLHHPIRVAEEWAMVDNLSKGRVAVSFASGWHADDFVFAPENYANRREVMLRDIETVRRLWRGEAVTVTGGAGNRLDVRIRPRPVQPELPVWLTAAGSPETFQTAGEIGAHVLTHLVGQSLDELQAKIALYRAAWQRSGHGPGHGHVTLMLHTFVGPDLDEVKEIVRRPLTTYVQSSADLIRKLAQSFGQDFIADDLSDADREALLAQAFERYFESSGLLGTPGVCLRMIERLKLAGVDEAACLIDFGVPAETVLASLPHLNLVRQQSGRQSAAARRRRQADYTLAAQIKKHNVTHMQCTPSLARLISAEPEALKAVGSLRKLLLGGEALPPALAQQLRTVMAGDIYNMYGPTETTIWSTTHRLDEVDGAIPIGRPITGTQTYILDRHLQPVPAGVPGELYIGGAGVARGYLRRPDVTAERFVPDPLGVAAGARLYRTGDLARYLPDGRIEFLGRLDRQVKLRGYRLELGEIEAGLAQYPGVREALVNVREGASGEKQLVAYVVTEQAPGAAAAQHATAPDAADVPADGRQSKLANGMVVRHVSAIHAHAAYQEIFEEEVYVKHGITLKDGDCVFDVGANIGMFSLFVNQRCKPGRLYAFEPIPAIFEVLEANMARYGVEAVLYEAGVSDRSGDSTFTFYPELPGLSGRYSDPERNKQTARALIFQHAGVPADLTGTLQQQELEEALQQRYRSETVRCRLTTVSEVIAAHNVERIDLLKVDVEKSELDVLNGIRDEDWPKIKQLVMEVETDELLNEITALLARHGLDYVVDEAVGVEGDGNNPGVQVYMLYAARRADGYQLRKEQARQAAQALQPKGSGAPAPNGHDRPPAARTPSAAELRRYLKERLPDYAVPSAFVFLRAWPLTPNGKIDHRALPEPERATQGAEPAADFTAPRTELEQVIAGVWQELLHVEQVGIHENFFDRGGHSLLALHVRNRLQEKLGRELSIVNLFKYPTIDALAKYLSEGQAGAQQRREEAQERADKQKQAMSRQRQLGKARKKRNE